MAGWTAWLWTRASNHWGEAVDEGTGSGLWQTAGGCGFVEPVADGRGSVVSQVEAEGGVVDVSEGRFEPVG